jgi:hypothetical protein
MREAFRFEWCPMQVKVKLSSHVLALTDREYRQCHQLKKLRDATLESTKISSDRRRTP